MLVIFPGALGDLMCVLPALAAISRRHPGASVELTARSELARLAAGRSVVTRGHSIDAREVGELFTDEPPVKARRFFADFDRIYSFFASDDRRFRARLAAATDAEVSFHPFRPDSDGHVSEAYLRSIGEAVSPLDSRLEPTPDDLAAAARALQQSKCDRSNLIVVFPGSGSAAKNWPAEKFAALATVLRERSGILPAWRRLPANLTPNRFPHGKGDRSSACVVILGPAEASLGPMFRESGVPVLKDLDLPTVAAVARLASAFVGNDSGVSHLAAAAGASGVVIFGPTDPARWRPIAAGSAQQIGIVRRNPIASIEVDEVADALSKICGATAKIID